MFSSAPRGIFKKKLFPPWHVFVAARISPSFPVPWSAKELRVDSWAKTPGVGFHLQRWKSNERKTQLDTWKNIGKRTILFFRQLDGCFLGVKFMEIHVATAVFQDHSISRGSNLMQMYGRVSPVLTMSQIDFI